MLRSLEQYWLFQPHPEPPTTGQVVLWWEKRRIAYNALILGVGFVSYVLLCLVAPYSVTLGPGEDVVEPILLILLPILINICYTLGWFVEGLMVPGKSCTMGPHFMKLGVAFSLFVVLFPTVLHTVSAFLQVAVRILG